MSIRLVTLAQAKRQAVVAHVLDDEYIDDLILAASAYTLTHIKRTDLSEWADDASPPNYDVPAEIKQATLIALTWMHEDRDGSNPVPQAFFSLLSNWRDPSMA